MTSNLSVNQGKVMLDGEEFDATIASETELQALEIAGLSPEEPCGRQECFHGWIWVLVDAPSGNGCQWYKTNARCNE